MLPFTDAVVLSLLLLGSSPRSAAEAVPASADFMLAVDDIGDQLQEALDGVEGVLGPRAADAFLSEAPLPALALEALGPGATDNGVDVHGPLGLFHLPSVPGAVGFVSVSSSSKAMVSLADKLRRDGGSVTQDGDFLVAHFADGRRFGACVVRGFLYLVLLDPDEAVGVTSFAMKDAVSFIRSTAYMPLSKHPDYLRARGRAGPAGVELFAREPLPGQPALQALDLVIRAEDDRVSVSGWLSSTVSLGEKAQADLLKDAPERPALVLQSSLPPAVWAEAVARLPNLESVAPAGAADVMGLLGSLRAPAALLFYPSSSLVLGDVAAGDGQMHPLGTVLARSEVTDSKTTISAVDRVAAWMSEAHVKRDGRHVTWTGTVQDQPVRLTLDGHSLTLAAGPDTTGRRAVDLRPLLQKRLVPSAFDPGHTSLLLDVSRFLSVATEPTQVEGLPPGEVNALQRTAVIVFRDLARIDYVLADLAPENGGGRIRMDIKLRDRRVGSTGWPVDRGENR